MFLKDLIKPKIKFSFKEIPEELSEIEDSLKEKKWFDYVGSKPEILDAVFFLEYVKAYRRYHAKVVDYKEAEDVIPKETVNDGGVWILNGSQTIKLRKARQAADSIGCRYPFYLSEAFDRVHRFGWHYFPTFQDLAYEETIADVEMAWDDHKKTILVLGEPEMMDVPTLGKYHAYLTNYIKQRPEHVRPKIIERLVRSGHLPESCA